MDTSELSKISAQRYIDLIDEFNDILGIIPPSNRQSEIVESVMDIIIDLRSQLRNRKIYDLSDMIRDRL